MQTAHGSLHLARKAEQVSQVLRDLGSSRRTRPLFYRSNRLLYKRKTRDSDKKEKEKNYDHYFKRRI